MRKFIHLKFVSTFLLLAMLTITMNGAHESAHAMQSHVNTASSVLEAPATQDTPCTPFEHHQDYDGCDSCVNCACHASLTIQPFDFGYNPIILLLKNRVVFEYLPKVYLSKFVPPQNLA
jgi:hypothetical protein